MSTKKVILFPGQGSQYKGMGKKLFPKYTTLSNKASTILGYDVAELCIKDPNKTLGNTQFTQPALYTVNYFQYLELGYQPDFLIGHSLGEYNALLAAGAYDFETGLRLVQKRGELMAAASGGGMAAVLGLSADAVKQKIAQEGYHNIDIANYNSPTQIVLSGTKEGIDRVVKNFTAQQIRIIPLKVSAPFHSRYMKPAVAQFSDFLNEFTFKKLEIPVIANVTARPYQEEAIANLLGQQIASSVQWTDSIRYLMGQEVSDFKELGRGVLTRMTKEIRDTCSPIKVDTEQLSKQAFSASPKVTAPLVETKHTRPAKTSTTEKRNEQLLAEKLGSAAFRKAYGTTYSYAAGATDKGVSSTSVVIRMAKAGMLAYLNTEGLALKEIEQQINSIQSVLRPNQVYGVGLAHQSANSELEMQLVELYLQKGIKNIEATDFLQLTEALVYFHVSGLATNQEGNIIRHHRILAKIDRPEVAEEFMRPAPEKILNRLFKTGKITLATLELAKQVPISEDICVVAGTAGITESRSAMDLFPFIQRQSKLIQEKYQYATPIRIGLAGCIGTPQAALSAFIMGADFIVTDTINQCTVEAGTSEAVKDLLEQMTVQDTACAPIGGLLEVRTIAQVLRKGVFFPVRANKLYQLYQQHDSLSTIPTKTVAQLERSYFKKSLSQIWQEIKKRLQQAGQAKEIIKAEQFPKHKMALVFDSYFEYSSNMAIAGNIEHQENFQIPARPALGSFNQWMKGTKLEKWRNRHVDEIGKVLMEKTGVLLQNRLQQFSKNQNLDLTL